MSEYGEEEEGGRGREGGREREGMGGGIGTAQITKSLKSSLKRILFYRHVSKVDI